MAQVVAARDVAAQDPDTLQAPAQVAAASPAVSRRRFIEASLLALGAGAAFAAGCDSDSDNNANADTGAGDTSPDGVSDADSASPDTAEDDADGTEQPPTLRVAIIGGGMAGLHCAYRLKKDYKLNATIYEASERTGGRMYSGRDLFADGQVCELGGELIDTGHLTMHALSEELSLQLDDRFANEPPGFHRDVYFIAGREVPEAEIVTAFTPLAAVMATTVEAAEADDALFETLDNTSMRAWLDAQPEATDTIKAILIEAYIAEYGLEAEQQSILNLLYFVDYETPDPFRIFGASDERYHTHAGNDAFTTALAAALDADQIKRQMRLKAARAEGSAYALTFTDASGADVVEEADYVVLALPFTLLREVDLTGLDLTTADFSDAQKRQVIQELGYGTNSKLMMGFSRDVWREDHNASGTSLSDFGFHNTWESSIGQAGDSAILTNFSGGTFGATSNQGTPEEVAAQILPKIDQVFPGVEAAYTGKAVRFHWPTAPFNKGSYGCYKPGQWAFYGSEGQRAGNILFCGEHTSLDNQGFMEGAAETGALAAQEIADDLALPISKGMKSVLGPKLDLPQSTYKAHTMQGLRWMERRRVARAVLGRRTAR
jgi:monoamine oxidase